MLFASVDAWALALGRLNVQSALGEPLRAEIDVAEATPEEIFALKVAIATPDAFRAAGVPFNPALQDVRANLQRRADGRYVVRLSSSRPMGEPFVDLLLEANWNSGRIVRDYTVLLDPPSSRAAAVASQPLTAPDLGPAPPPRAIAPRPTVVAQAAAPRPRPAPVPAPSAPNSSSVRATGGSEQQVTVRAGDTASKIAGAYKPADISLDQMLVALLRANPGAFINGNVNRIKAGAVLDLPSSSQASAMPADEAKRTVTAQSRDFTDYRRRLADNAPETGTAAAGRSAAGRLQASVEDRNANNAASDKLRISQSGASGQTEEQLAKAGQAKESSTRVAEISKNINELNKLQASSAGGSSPAVAGAPTTATGSSAAAPGAANASATPSGSQGVGVNTPAAMASAAAPAGAASASAVAPSTAGTAPAAPAAGAPVGAVPAASPAPTSPSPDAAAAKAAPATTPERGFLGDLLDNPLMLAGAGLVALLVGVLLFRRLGRKQADAGDSVFLESRMPKDSFFGASGGESVDTKNRGHSVMSSLSYSPSQLDAGDVDPVAEADVYLAYGRDLQAEEILREALRVNPERLAIHMKLLEIHVKRRDVRAFESLATDVHRLTGGTGADWERTAEMGRELDPGNPLYDISGSGVSAAEAAAFAGSLAAATTGSAPLAHASASAPLAPFASPVPAPAPTHLPALQDVADPPAFVPSVAPLDFDLDLNTPPTVAKPAPSLASPAAAALPAASESGDPYPATIREPQRTSSAVAPAAPVLPAEEALLGPELRLDLDNDFDTAPGLLDAPTARAPLDSPTDDLTQPATLRAGLPGDSGFIEFDMSSMAGLSGRDRADTEPGQIEVLDEGSDSPHAIKLSLARELRELGDVEGARSLVEEVAAEGSGDVKEEARELLGQLG